MVRGVVCGGLGLRVVDFVVHQVVEKVATLGDLEVVVEGGGLGLWVVIHHLPVVVVEVVVEVVVVVVVVVVVAVVVVVVVVVDVVVGAFVVDTIGLRVGLWVGFWVPKGLTGFVVTVIVGQFDESKILSPPKSPPNSPLVSDPANGGLSGVTCWSTVAGVANPAPKLGLSAPGSTLDSEMVELKGGRSEMPGKG